MGCLNQEVAEADDFLTVLYRGTRDELLIGCARNNTLTIYTLELTPGFGAEPHIMPPLR